MANLKVKDQAGDTKYMKTSGAGTDGDPHIPEHSVTNGGTFAVQVDGDALTALQLIDNMISGSEAQVDVVAALPAGTNFIGASAPQTVTKDLTLSLDTNIYASGDVLADSQEITSVNRASGEGVELVSMIVRDKDDQTAAAMTFFFFDANTSLGTENSAPDIDDTEIDALCGIVAIPASAWIDMGGSKVACMSNLGLLMHPAATSLWLAATTGGTPTQTASGITVTMQFIKY